MKNKRLYAIVLLVALALLQVRVAFAACEFGQQNAVESIGAAPCGEPQATGCAMSAMDDMAALSCAPSACLDQYAAQEPDHSTPLSPGFSALAHAPRAASFTAYRNDAPLRAAVTPAHAAHTRLIYVLQRLLI